MIDENIGEKIKALRLYLGLSQAAFSMPLGLSPTHIARFEKDVSVPSRETINKICEAFDVDESYFELEINVEDAVVKKDYESGIVARQEKGLSQLELAKRSGVGQSIISRVELGAKLTEKQGIKLAEALEVGVDWLMRGKEQKKNYPADGKLINWLWNNEDVRIMLWKIMKEE